jgi:hypothetical protein
MVGKVCVLFAPRLQLGPEGVFLGVEILAGAGHNEELIVWYAEFSSMRCVMKLGLGIPVTWNGFQ